MLFRLGCLILCFGCSRFVSQCSKLFYVFQFVIDCAGFLFKIVSHVLGFFLCFLA